jgi:DNA-binding HxlR family transcriptional regulator
MQSYFATACVTTTYPKVRTMTAIKTSSTNQLNKQGALTKCPVSFFLLKMGGRWKPLIIFQLTAGPKRFGELRNAIPAISEKMLTQSLKELEADGIIIRTELDTTLSHVEYNLSECGDDLRPVFLQMVTWSRKYNVI